MRGQQTLIFDPERFKMVGVGASFEPNGSA